MSPYPTILELGMVMHDYAHDNKESTVYVYLRLMFGSVLSRHFLARCFGEIFETPSVDN